MVDKQYLTWKQRTDRFSNGCNGYRIRMRLFSIDWDSLLPRDSTIPPWRLTTALPELKPAHTHFKDIEQAKAAAEQVFVSWCTAINVEPRKGK